jgi:excisionase family DNA binding protein
MPKLLTVNQLCEILQVSQPTLRKYRRRGLPTVYLGTHPRFNYDDVLVWIASGRMNPISERRERA